MGSVVRNKPRTFWLLSRMLPTLRGSIYSSCSKKLVLCRKEKETKQSKVP